MPCRLEDRSGIRPSDSLRLNPQDKHLDAFLRTGNFYDVWRILHPVDREYTHFSHAQSSFSRIDFFLSSSSLLSCFVDVTIEDMLISDHAPVLATLQNVLVSGPPTTSLLT